MKRGRLKVDPDKVRAWQQRSRKALPAMSARKRGNHGPWTRAKVVVRRRSGGLCEARTGERCAGRGQHVHHVLPRSRGGKDNGSTPLLDVCFPCHEWIHGHPSEARERGWLV